MKQQTAFQLLLYVTKFVDDRHTLLVFPDSALITAVILEIRNSEITVLILDIETRPRFLIVCASTSGHPIISKGGNYDGF